MIVVASTFSNNSLSELHMKYFSRTSFRLQHSSRMAHADSVKIGVIKLISSSPSPNVDPNPIRLGFIAGNHYISLRPREMSESLHDDSLVYAGDM